MYRYITNPQCDQLLVGLIAQLVERCAGIAEVMGLNSVQAKIFFQAFKMISLHSLEETTNVPKAF